MSETRDSADAPFAPNPEPIDGHFLVTKKRCPIKVAELNARLMALPESSELYRLNTWLMGFIHPIRSEGEYREMMATIDELRKVWKGENECTTTKLTNCSDQKLSTSRQPDVMTT